MKDNLLVLDKTGTSLYCIIGNDGLVCISRNSTRTQTNSTIHSMNNNKNSFEMTIPELPKMIKDKLFTELDDETLSVKCNI